MVGRLGSEQHADHSDDIISPIILSAPLETIYDLFYVGKNVLTGGYMLHALWITTQEVLVGFGIAFGSISLEETDPKNPFVLTSTANAAERGPEQELTCLRGGGPIVRITGDRSEQPFERKSWEPSTTFDARGASWRASWMPGDQARNCFPIALGASWGTCPPGRIDLYSGEVPVPDPAPPTCLTGGVIIGTQPRGASWHQVKKSTGMAVTVNAQNPIIQGMRIDNAEDAFVPFRSVDFVIRGNWVSYNRDDCVENDAFASGVIEDNLFDGCYVFYSSQNQTVEDAPVAPEGGRSGLVTIRDNLIWLRNMPGPYKKPADAMGFGRALKDFDSRAPALALHGNIFLMEAPIDHGWLGLHPRKSELRSCSDNTIVWLGDGDYPGSYPEGCFVVTRDISVWEQAKRDWLKRHPDVTRLAGDEQ